LYLKVIFKKGGKEKGAFDSIGLGGEVLGKEIYPMEDLGEKH